MFNIPSYILHLILFFLVIFILNQGNKEQPTRTVNSTAIEAIKVAEETALAHAKLKSDKALNLEVQRGKIFGRYVKNNTVIDGDLYKKQLSEKTKQKFHEISKNTKIYYVGVYESNNKEYTSSEEQARLKECNEKYDLKIEKGIYPTVRSCWDYAFRSEKENVRDIVIIHVNVKKPIVLVLTNYDAVEWVVKGNTQNIKMIYLSGYHGSEIHTNISQDKIYSSFYKEDKCEFCMASHLPYFYGYENLDQNMMENYFGQPVSYFQGKYKAKEFYLND